MCTRCRLPSPPLADLAHVTKDGRGCHLQAIVVVATSRWFKETRRDLAVVVLAIKDENGLIRMDTADIDTDNFSFSERILESNTDTDSVFFIE
jgi:hypothetical protein